MTTRAHIRALVLALPGVEEKAHFGSPSFRVQGRLFIQLSDDKDEAIFKLSKVHQEILFETRPETFRAEVWGAIRWSHVVLAGVTAHEAPELVREAYDQVAKPARKPSAKRAAAPRR